VARRVLVGRIEDRPLEESVDFAGAGHQAISTLNKRLCSRIA
jgi:hypothetical protein